MKIKDSERTHKLHYRMAECKQIPNKNVSEREKTRQWVRRTWPLESRKYTPRAKSWNTCRRIQSCHRTAEIDKFTIYSKRCKRLSALHATMGLNRAALISPSHISCIFFLFSLPFNIRVAHRCLFLLLFRIYFVFGWVMHSVRDNVNNANMHQPHA